MGVFLPGEGSDQVRRVQRLDAEGVTKSHGDSYTELGLLRNLCQDAH
jgi:hypothetical protein